MKFSSYGIYTFPQQVLRLVHYLVRYGYYGEMEDLQKLLDPLLSLLDGRNDKPYPYSTGKPYPYLFIPRTASLLELSTKIA